MKRAGGERVINTLDGLKTKLIENNIKRYENKKNS